MLRGASWFVVLILAAVTSSVAAQPTPPVPATPPPPLQPEGLWEGSIQCGPGPFRMQVAIVDNRGVRSAVLSVPQQRPAAQVAYSTDVQVAVLGDELAVTGPSLAGGAPLSARGTVQSDNWTLTLTEGTATCRGTLTRTGPAKGAWLDVPPVYQATPMWCWLTAGEMLFEYYGVLPRGSFGGYSQCQIMQTIYLGSANYRACAANCNACTMLGGSSSREVQGMIVDFPHRLATLTQRRVPRLFAATASAVKSAEVAMELEGGHPLVAAISPSQGANLLPSMGPFAPAQHVVLIVGYIEVKGRIWYRINDPFPYVAQRQPIPYVALGGLVHVTPTSPGTIAYWITDAALRTGLNWSETFLARADGEHVP